MACPMSRNAVFAQNKSVEQIFINELERGQTTRAVSKKTHPQSPPATGVKTQAC